MLGLLARTELRRAMGELGKARRDLERRVLSPRGGTRLHEADRRLQYARWYIARGDRSMAREHPAMAKNMIEEMGYHRRDQEVSELAELLAS